MTAGPNLPGLALSVETIRAHLKTRTIGATLHVHDEVDSTNRVLADLAREGAPNGTVVVAESQTAGRGRQGRRWVSPAGVNLYLSVMLDGTASSTVTGWFPLLAAVAVARAIKHETGLSTTVKWPNDVEVSQEGQSHPPTPGAPRRAPSRGRKIAGILAEATGGDQNNRRIVVVGIGVNVNAPNESFPAELQARATSLLSETGRPADRAELLATLLLEIERLYDSVLAQGTAGIREAYLHLSNTIGKQVRVELVGGEKIQGTAESIALDGALCLRAVDGTVVEIRAGDVVHLR